MGNTPCCEASGADRPSRRKTSSTSSSDEDDEKGALSRTRSARSDKIRIDKALRVPPGTPTAGKKLGKTSSNANLVVTTSNRDTERRARAMKKEAKDAELDSDSSTSSGSDTSDDESEDGFGTPKRSSSKRSEPLGAPRGKKTNSFLDAASDDDDDDGSGGGKRASRSKKSGQKAKKKKDRSKGKRRS